MFFYRINIFNSETIPSVLFYIPRIFFIFAPLQARVCNDILMKVFSHCP